MNRLRKRLRQLAWGIGFVVLLLGIFIVVEHLRGRIALSARLKELIGHGEILSVAALTPPRVSAEANAVPPLVAIKTQISQLRSNLLDLPPCGRFTGPGQTMAGWQVAAWSADKKTNGWTHIDRALENQAPVLEAIHAALQRTNWDTGFDYTRGFCEFESPPLVEFRSANQILVVAAAANLREGRTNVAVERLIDAIKLVELQGREPLIISQLVRIACAAITWNCTWEFLQTNVWSETQLARIQAAWQAIDFGGDMAKALEMERAMTLDTFKILAADSGKMHSMFEQQEAAEEFIGGAFYTLPAHGAVLHWGYLPLWRAAWLNQDALRSLDRWQNVLETDRLARRESWVAARERAEKFKGMNEEFSWMPPERETNEPGLYDRWRFLLSNQALGVAGGMFRRSLQSETSRGMMVSVLAIKRHILRHGQAPASLDALVPQFLPAVPLDKMDGKPLRYRANRDGSFLLYSVGEDGVDNGGDPTPAKPEKRFVQIWDGKDAVWPVLVTSEEAVMAAWR